MIEIPARLMISSHTAVQGVLGIIIIQHEIILEESVKLSPGESHAKFINLTVNEV